MAYQPNHKPTNKRTQKAAARARRCRDRHPRQGIGGEVITGATDVCVPIWAALIIGGLGAYGAMKAVGK